MNLGPFVTTIDVQRDGRNLDSTFEVRRLRLREILALVLGRRLYFSIIVDARNDQPLAAKAAIGRKGQMTEHG